MGAPHRGHGCPNFPCAGIASWNVVIFTGINLAIHEGGHLFFMWFGIDFVTVAGGTFLQCVCPIVTGIMFYKQRDFFAISVACFWLGTNLAHIAP